MRRPLTLLVSSVVATLLVAPAALIAVSPTSAATTIAATTTCSNGEDNTPGLGVLCEVTIDNTITRTGGSATVTVTECHGAAGDPRADCTTVTQVLTEPVTEVTQCNDTVNGGGGTLRCSVQVTNTFIGVISDVTAATVNQCVGSGDGITIGCAPFPATTSGATITQCNGSANGGTLVGLICTATGTQASALNVTINQCNDSANGGGALVICSADITNIVVAASPSPTDDVPVPTDDVPVPTEDVPVPTADVPVPTDDVPVPTEDVPVPTADGVIRATLAADLPDTDLEGDSDAAAGNTYLTVLVALVGLLASALLLRPARSERRRSSLHLASTDTSHPDR